MNLKLNPQCCCDEEPGAHCELFAECLEVSAGNGHRDVEITIPPFANTICAHCATEPQGTYIHSQYTFSSNAVDDYYICTALGRLPADFTLGAGLCHPADIEWTILFDESTGLADLHVDVEWFGGIMFHRFELAGVSVDDLCAGAEFELPWVNKSASDPPCRKATPQAPVIFRLL